MQKYFTISELAREAKVNVQTVRYYERRGLLLPAKRTGTGGYRLYTEDSLKKLAFIGRAKELGFTLKEAGEMLELSAAPSADFDSVRKKAEEKLIAVDQKIDSLRSVRKVLKDLVKACEERKPVTEWPLLMSIEKGYGKNDR